MVVNAGVKLGRLNDCSECWSLVGNAEWYQLMLVCGREC